MASLVRPLAVNAILGLLILVVANAAGFAVQVSAITLAICAILGIPGALIVILLAYLEIAFGAALVVPLLV